MSKRNFILIALYVIIMNTNIGSAKDATTSATPKIKDKVAMYYQKLKDNIVECGLCFRECLIAPGKRGVCGVRENRDGTLYSVVYGKPCAVHIDPIEKEPVYHVFPGRTILCIATTGCSLRCKFCQNWSISQVLPEHVDCYNMTPKQVVELAVKNGCVGVSFTYSEPTVFYEYMLDICKEAKSAGILSIIHTCGVINPEPLKAILPYVDAVTVDIKGFNEEFYAKVAGQDAAKALDSVLQTVKIIKESGTWLELVNLMIPDYNDDPEDIKRMCKWIVDNLGADVPLHFSRFYPAFKLTMARPTPVKTLEKARQIAIDAGLRYVTVGNVPGHDANSTFCYKCGKVLIKRHHFEVLENNIKSGKCKFCNTPVAGIWE